MNLPLNSRLAAIPGNTGFSLCGVSRNGTHRLKRALRNPHQIKTVTSSVFYHLRKMSPIPQKDSNVFYHLRTIQQIAAKTPLCFLSLTDHVTRNYQCFLSLTKKAGGGVAPFASRCPESGPTNLVGRKPALQSFSVGGSLLIRAVV
jgi:hypothetical protein